MAHRGDGAAHLQIVSDHSESDWDVFVGIAKLLELNPDFLELYVGFSLLGLRAEAPGELVFIGHSRPLNLIHSLPIKAQNAKTCRRLGTQSCR